MGSSEGMDEGQDFCGWPGYGSGRTPKSPGGRPMARKPRRWSGTLVSFMVLVVWCSLPVSASDIIPPSRMNYQGVLRDQNSVPLSGTYDMTFRFFDAATGGNEIVVDQH